jgi:hypothetical protein
MTLTKGELLVKAYIKQRRWNSEYEPDVPGTRRKLDFRVNHRSGPFFIEVYEPAIPEPDENRHFFIDRYPALRRMFSQRKRAQVKAARIAGLPFVGAVLDSNSPFPINPNIMSGAMFGDLAFSFPVDEESEGENVKPGRMIYAGGGRVQPKQNRGVSSVVIPRVFNPTAWRITKAIDDRLGPEARSWHPGLMTADLEKLTASYLKALAEVQERLTDLGEYKPDEARVRMIALHNPFAERTLSKHVFNGAYDEQWDGVTVGTSLGYARVWTGRLIKRVPNWS